MNDQPSLHAAADQVARVVADVRADQLSAPTPCPEYVVGDLLDHLVGLTQAFTGAARKGAPDRLSGPPPLGRADHLVDDWRTVLPQRLDELAAAWDDASAWEGETRAGGIEMPAQVAGLVALNEVLVHGWDLAAATGQPYDPDPDLLAALQQFTGQFDDAGAPGAFGPRLEVESDARPLARVLADNGRDVAWRPALAH